MSVCAKFQLSSWFRSGRKVWGGVGFKWLLCLISTKLLLSCFELSWVELRWDLTTTTHQISQLILTRSWWNFKWRFLGTSRTDSNCQGDICPDNICPGDICPYQEYLSCYWPDFDDTLKKSSWEHVEQIPTVMVTFVQATFVLVTFAHIRNISPVTDPILTKP